MSRGREEAYSFQGLRGLTTTPVAQNVSGPVSPSSVGHWRGTLERSGVLQGCRLIAQVCRLGWGWRFVWAPLVLGAPAPWWWGLSSLRGRSFQKVHQLRALLCVPGQVLSLGFQQRPGLQSSGFIGFDEGDKASLGHGIPLLTSRVLCLEECHLLQVCVRWLLLLQGHKFFQKLLPRKGRQDSA